jgi:SAM-dependent methyltransferase
MERRFSGVMGTPAPIAESVERSLTQGRTSLLEIGCGEGRALLELRHRWPQRDLRLYGINKKPEHNMTGPPALAANAREFGLIVPSDDLPVVDFYDAGEGLRFETASIDLVVSQVAFHYVAEKARLLEEIWRVLRPGGQALVHVDNRVLRHNGPDFMADHLTPRFVIYGGTSVLPFSEFGSSLKDRGYDITVAWNPQETTELIAIMRRSDLEHLDLGLTLDRVSSFDLTELRGRDQWKGKPSGWWGTRSVYRLGAG